MPVAATAGTALAVTITESRWTPEIRRAVCPPGPLRPRAGAHARCWQTVTAMLRLACHCTLACAHDHANGFQPSVERRRRHAELRDAASAPGWPAAAAAFGNTSPHRRGSARSPAVAQFTWNWMGRLTRSPRPGRLAPGVLGAFGVPEGPEKQRWSEFFWANGRGRCAVDLRKEGAVSRIACIYVDAWAVCSSVGSSRAGVTVVSRAHTTACPHATAGRRPEKAYFST